MNSRIAIVLMMTSLASVCTAESKPTTKKQPPVTAKQYPRAKTVSPKFQMSMIEGDRIDPRYAGLPISDVVDAVEKLSGLKKDEFESTTEFNARKADALARKFLGNSTVEDTFAFVVPVTKVQAYSSGIWYKFNADTAELSLFALAKLSSMNGIGAPDYETSRRPTKGLDQFDLDFKVDSTKTYKASNAYGATITVEETVSTRLGIAANRIPFLTYERQSYYSNLTPSIQLNMENAKAAKELPALKALIVMKLAAPYIAYHFIHSEPTRDSPIELTSQGKYLTGDVLGMIFYSGLTGEVFARLPDGFGKPEPRTEAKSDGQ